MPITPFAGYPNRGSQSPEAFSNSVDSFFSEFPRFVTEANTLIGTVNDAEAAALSYMDQSAISANQAQTSATQSANRATEAAASANFRGAWSSLSGALNIPASVLHNGRTWRLKPCPPRACA